MQEQSKSSSRQVCSSSKWVLSDSDISVVEADHTEPVAEIFLWPLSPVNSRQRPADGRVLFHQIHKTIPQAAFFGCTRCISSNLTQLPRRWFHKPGVTRQHLRVANAIGVYLFLIHKCTWPHRTHAGSGKAFPRFSTATYCMALTSSHFNKNLCEYTDASDRKTAFFGLVQVLNQTHFTHLHTGEWVSVFSLRKPVKAAC